MPEIYQVNIADIRKELDRRAALDAQVKTEPEPRGSKKISVCIKTENFEFLDTIAEASGLSIDNYLNGVLDECREKIAQLINAELRMCEQ